MAATRVRYDKKKLRELVLYIAEKSETDRYFGAVKLNKLLFCSDFAHYMNTGKAISGSRYQKLDYGPAPRPLLPVVEELQEEGACTRSVRPMANKSQNRLIALRRADLSVFEAQEISLVDQVIEEFWEHNASQVSDWSHRFIGWELAEIGEDIPYETALVGVPRPLTDSEIAYGRELARGLAQDGN